eukprot:6214670-Pleurochrysis_carterae.AAC.3
MRVELIWQQCACVLMLCHANNEEHGDVLWYTRLKQTQSESKACQRRHDALPEANHRPCLCRGVMRCNSRVGCIDCFWNRPNSSEQGVPEECAGILPCPTCFPSFVELEEEPIFHSALRSCWDAIGCRAAPRGPTQGRVPAAPAMLVSELSSRRVSAWRVTGRLAKRTSIVYRFLCVYVCAVVILAGLGDGVLDERAHGIVVGGTKCDQSMFGAIVHARLLRQN